ncbi:hypothetical protein P7K49_018590, partial [Saguinus oedipus]
TAFHRQPTTRGASLYRSAVASHSQHPGNDQNRCLVHALRDAQNPSSPPGAAHLTPV